MLAESHNTLMIYLRFLKPFSLIWRLKGTLRYPDLYRAYQLKERLRIILHLKDPYLAEEELRKWVNDARNSELQYFVPLADKLERHVPNILRSIECHANSAKSEATNTTIKALIKTARGFRNLDNMFGISSSRVGLIPSSVSLYQTLFRHPPVNDDPGRLNGIVHRTGDLLYPPRFNSMQSVQ